LIDLFNGFIRFWSLSLQEQLLVIVASGLSTALTMLMGYDLYKSTKNKIISIKKTKKNKNNAE
jgi:hypothetical protein